MALPASCGYLKQLPGCCTVLFTPGSPGPDLERPGHVLNHCQQIWIPFALCFVALSHATDAWKMTTSQKISPCFLSQGPTTQLRYKVWVLTTSLTAASVQTCSEHQARLSHSGGCAQGTHAVSLSWQVSPELAEIYFLSTGLTYGSPEGVCIEAFCVEAFIPTSGREICIMTCYRYSAAGT